MRWCFAAQHLGDYEGAKEAVAAAKGAIIPRPAAASAAAQLSELWVARAAEANRLRKQLPPLLEAARDGDLATLCALLDEGWCAAPLSEMSTRTCWQMMARGGWWPSQECRV